MAENEQVGAQGHLDIRYQRALDKLYADAEAQGIELVDVDYNGEGGVYNYDIAPWNIVKDEARDYVGQSATLQPGATYKVPAELAQKLYLTEGFAPAGEQEPSDQAGGASGPEKGSSETPPEPEEEEEQGGEAQAQTSQEVYSAEASTPRRDHVEEGE